MHCVPLKDGLLINYSQVGNTRVRLLRLEWREIFTLVFVCYFQAEQTDSLFVYIHYVCLLLIYSINE